MFTTRLLKFYNVLLLKVFFLGKARVENHTKFVEIFEVKKSFFAEFLTSKALKINC